MPSVRPTIVVELREGAVAALYTSDRKAKCVLLDWDKVKAGNVPEIILTSPLPKPIPDIAWALNGK